MAKSARRLNAIKTANVKSVGMHPDGAGLYLKVGSVSAIARAGEHVLPFEKSAGRKAGALQCHVGYPPLPPGGSKHFVKA